MHNKKEVLIENYQTISNASAQNELESDEFAVTFDNLCSNGNIMALILQQDGKVLRSSVNDLDAVSYTHLVYSGGGTAGRCDQYREGSL